MIVYLILNPVVHSFNFVKSKIAEATSFIFDQYKLQEQQVIETNSNATPKTVKFEFTVDSDSVAGFENILPSGDSSVDSAS